MPENVTGFQPTGNLKKSLIDLAYFDMFPRRSPTFFREEPELKLSFWYKVALIAFAEFAR